VSGARPHAAAAAVAWAAGETGAAVEARILGGPRLTGLALTTPPPVAGPVPVAAPAPMPPPPFLVRTVVPPPVPPPPPPLPRQPTATVGDILGGAESRLLLVGEPGVGRLAVLARRRLELLHEAGARIGTTLDVTRTAEELAEVTVARFADFVAVDLPDAVLRGEEPEELPTINTVHARFAHTR
jgi:hypothetical protein